MSDRQDALAQAQALERQGRSREACSVLSRALAKEPRRIDWMQTLAWWLYRDGRERELLQLLDKGPASYSQDAYLVLQKASCLARLQRLAEARKEYRRVLELTQDAALRKQAEHDLAWLREEEATDKAVRAGLSRARLGILAGTLVLGGSALFFWMARRRESVSRPGADRGQKNPLEDV